ncbi:cytochrome p450 [Trifolium pratense]|uniref:Cytochrome p450 n=1 Tax=Trifolium pratense TaxID=57577 RepID=A0A2K3P5J8_TRIPR|nr:cytochrome p450 [Trifolium pratense]
MTKEIMKTNDFTFCDRPNLLLSTILTYNATDIAFSTYGEHWRQIRKICVIELLNAKSVQSFRSIREEEVSNLVKSISASEGSVVNLTHKILATTYGIIAQTAFGKRNIRQEAFKLAIDEALTLLGGVCIVDLYPSIKMLQRHPLADDNLKAVIQHLFTAGGETSSGAVLWATSEMVKNPKVMEEAQVEVRRVFDGKGERCQINGYEIPAKTRIVVNAWAIGRNPRYWIEADSFKPERFVNSLIDFKGTDFEYIPFGAGRRMCPGIAFAIPNVELPLAQLLYNFDWKLPNGMKNEELNMTESFGITAGRKYDLCLIPITRRT